MSLFSDLRKLLNRSQKRRYFALQLIFFVAAIVQVVSIGSIAPFVSVLSQSELIRTNAWLSRMYHLGGFTSEQSFMIAFAALLMIVIVIGNIVPAYMGYLSWGFVRRLAVEVQSDVYRGFIYGDLARLARLSTSQMTSSVTQGVNRLLYNVVMPLLTLVSNGFIILLIAFGLLIFNPIVATVAATVVGGGYFAVFMLSKKRLSHHGRVSWSSLEAKQRLMSESLGGIKEVRLAALEAAYEERLHDITDTALRSEAKVGLYGDLPRFALESLALCALLGLGIFMLVRNDDWSSIVAILSVYAMAGYRLLPAAQHVFRSATTLRANLDVVEDLTRDVTAGRVISAKPREPATSFAASHPIVVSNVSFRYPGEEKDVLKSVTLQIERNSVTALVGKSGAGKSTLADLLLGLITPTSGEITIDGISIHSATRSWQRSVALVSQSVFLTDDTVEANITFGSTGPKHLDRLKRAAAMAHAEEFINNLPGGYSCRIGEAGGRLSGGQRQRLGIARALYNDAHVIVLDEPTSALDSVAEREVLAAIDSLKREKTIILITHRLSSLRNVDHIVLLNDGQIESSGAFGELERASSSFRHLLASH